MLQLEWQDPSRRLVPYHLEEAIERARFGVPGLVFSMAIGLAALSGIAIGVVTPAPAREAPPLATVLDLDPECALAEFSCEDGLTLPSASGLRAELSSRL
jgi:hypothetical protein